MSAQPSLINLQVIATPEKAIHVAEVDKHLPFEVKRIYWITATTPALEVGNHAHLRLSQVFVAINGSITVSLTAVTGEEETYVLNNPATGLLVPPLFWKRLQFSPDGILLCFTSHLYDEADYIKNLTEFHALAH